MWPLLLDMTKEESVQNLRCLELEAYAGLVTALRAQGSLSQDKLNVLKEMCIILNISQERHKAEIRRVVNDEKLTTIAYHASGQKLTNDEWLQEGKRLIPLMPRIAPQTAYSAIADEVADATSKVNKQLPLPSHTERKRQSPVAQTSTAESQNKLLFRMPDLPKPEESKKRKFLVGIENSSLSQHLMCPPKVSRIQQIYRQKSKAKQKEFQLKLKQNELDRQQEMLTNQQQQAMCSQKVVQPPTSAVNIKTSKSSGTQIAATTSSNVADELVEQDCEPPAEDEEEEVDIQKVYQTVPSKTLQAITLKHVPSNVAGANVAGPAEIPKTIKVCTAKKPAITKTMTTSTGQKLIVVSNPQSGTTPSILQRTLTIPFVKNISVKNIDKFKIVTTNSTNAPVQIAPLTSAKHKVVTVRTNPIKKVIPISQLQVLNAKGNIKVLPIGGKIVTKANGNSSTSSSIYIVNSSTNTMQTTMTKSTTSSPSVVMSSMAQDSCNKRRLDEDDNRIERYRMEEVAITEPNDKEDQIVGNDLNDDERMAFDGDVTEVSDPETTDEIQTFKITGLDDQFNSESSRSNSDDAIDCMIMTNNEILSASSSSSSTGTMISDKFAKEEDRNDRLLSNINKLIDDT